MGDAMEKILYTQINLFSLLILLLIYLNVHRQSDTYFNEQKLFLVLLYCNALILILDSFMWILDGVPGSGITAALSAVTTVYYILNPVICMVWSVYADYQIHRNSERNKRITFIMSIPILVYAIAVIISNYNNLFFYIDKYNHYHRGNYFILVAMFCYAYLLYSLISIILSQRKFKNENFIPMLVFAFPPIIGGFIQYTFYGVSVIWSCITLSILILFIKIQNKQLYMDHLTQVYNRRQLDYYLKEKITKCTEKTQFTGAMIDINNFKQINDQYGHAAGDAALVYLSHILKKTFPQNTFIARYGGDEFVIIMDVNEKVSINQYIGVLRDNMNNFNLKNIVPYSLEISIGCDFYDTGSNMNDCEFLNHIDNLMYLEKENYRTE